MNKIQFLNKLEDILMIDKNLLQEETELETLDDWDSLAMMSLISLIEDELQEKLTIAQLMNAKKVSDLFSLIANHLD